MKNEPKYYYKLKLEKGEWKPIPYPFKNGEKEEYESICELAEGWGGKPCDIDWAKNTKPYKEAEIKYKINETIYKKT